MNADLLDFSSFPYKRFSDIRIKNNEPLTYSLLNAHIMRLCSNLEYLGITNTLQKATYDQWGTVKKATENDIIDTNNGVKTSVITNDILNKVFDTLKDSNSDRYFREKILGFSKNYEFHTGEFLVGANEKMAKKITSSPSNVVFTNIDIMPVGYDNKPFHTTRKDKTSSESYGTNAKTYGIINFKKTEEVENYNEFHVYYHKSGYIICENGKIDENQKQMKVCWTQLVRI